MRFEKTKKLLKSSPAFSLVEVMIAITILSVVALGTMSVYYGVSKGLVLTSARTTSSIMAKDKLESMKEIPFARVIATPNYYPPETYTVNQIEYTRYTTVYKMAEDENGDLYELDSADASEGIKKIEVKITWTDKNGSPKELFMENLLQDPNRSIKNGAIMGRVKYNPSMPQGLSAASVAIVQNMNWKDNSDTDGDYNIYVTTGTYDVTVSKRGYFTQTQQTTVTKDNTPVILDFILIERAVGTVQGFVYEGTTSVKNVGAIVTCDDGNSALSMELGAGYNLTDVTTGYWNLTASSGTMSLTGSTTNVHVTDGGMTIADIRVYLSTTTYGSISGIITCGGMPVSGITVSAGDRSAETNINGLYLITNVETSTYTVVANPEPANDDYTTETYTGVYVEPGFNTPNIDISLFEAGDVSGKITIAVSGDDLPDIIIKAVVVGGEERDATVSDSSGDYVFERLPLINDYTIQPVLDPDDTSVPESQEVTLIQGSEVEDIDFVITPSKGNIIGVVTDGGNPITTGVLIIVSTSTISSPPNPPPTINSAFRAGSVIFYGTVSDVQGNYSVSVYTDEKYNLAAWYTFWNGDSLETLISEGSVEISVSTTTAVWNFLW